MNGLQFLYQTYVGRILLRPLVARPISDLSGKLLDARVSKLLIKPFVKKNEIDTEEYQLEHIHSFNDFFCRKIKDGLRPISMEATDFIAPCDGLLSVHKISSGDVIAAKQSRFTVKGMLRDKELAKQFDGGYCLVYRLCVNHYHRYIYFEDGYQYETRRINGIYHTVRPIALEKTPVFMENTREYNVIDTKNFGRCVQMEVGAMLVGRIVNEQKRPAEVRRGAEKGHFEYGGSTIIVLVGKNHVRLRDDLLSAAVSREEIPVKMGEVIGAALQM